MTWDAKADTVGQDAEDGAGVVHEVKGALLQVEPGWVSQSCGWDLIGGEREGQKLAERNIKASFFPDFLVCCTQATTGLADTVLADKLSEKMTILEEIWLVLFTGFEDTTASGDKKDLTVFFR